MMSRNYTIVGPTDEDQMQVNITIKDILGTVHHLVVPYQGLINHELGQGYIQDNFPDLTPEQRELFLTGIPGGMWNEIFDKDE
mgnify:CR=1 FL=1